MCPGRVQVEGRLVPWAVAGRMVVPCLRLGGLSKGGLKERMCFAPVTRMGPHSPEPGGCVVCRDGLGSGEWLGPRQSPGLPALKREMEGEGLRED